MQLLYEMRGLGERCMGGYVLRFSKLGGHVRLEATRSNAKIFQVHPIQQENKKINGGVLLPGSVHGKASVPAPARSTRSTSALS